nr:hypothetical protein [Pseudomonas granadensis]
MTMKSMWISAAAFGGWLMAGQAWSDCTPPAVSGDADFSVCKDWPAHPGQSISAKATFERAAGPDGGTSGFYDLDLSIAQDVQAGPIATFHQDSAFESNGVALHELTLDTARYSVAPDIRAFGVRSRFTNSSRLNPLDETQLTLYVREGETLRPVLQQLLVYQYGGEWDGNCEGERSEITRTVEIAKTSSHGYADLIVRTRETGTSSVGKGDACKDKITESKPVSTTLRYDGKSYVVPQGLKGL